MANVKFPRKEFEEQVGKIDEKLQSQISLFGTPLESLSEEEIEIEIFPNRPDLLSMQGYIRAFKAFIGKSPGLQKYKIHAPEKNYKVTIDSSVKTIRPHTACAIVKNLSLDSEKIKEIIELQEKLHGTVGRNRKKVAIGIYPLEKIKLPIKYKAESPEKIKFIPLESDKELSGSQILSRNPTGRDYAHLLEDFDKFPVFRDANSKVLSMPPIINSHETGKITEQTSSVFIECTGSDLQTLKRTINIITTTLADMGAEIYAMTLQYSNQKITTPDLTPEQMKISIENINSLLGLNLKESDLALLLPKMGYDYSKGKVTIPAWRSDILHEVDIAEDVAIAYGYDKFTPQIPDISTTASQSKEAKIKSKLSEILIGLGLQEISSYHLIKQEEVKLSKLQEPIELEDSKTDYKILRPNLLIPTLRIFSENKDSEFPQRIFEIGSVFKRSPSSETGIKEQNNLIISISPGNFTQIKQILDYLTKSINVSYELKETTKKQLIEGRTAEILFNGKPSGFIGEVNPQTLRAWNIRMPISLLEISLEEIFNSL